MMKDIQFLSDSGICLPCVLRISTFYLFTDLIVSSFSKYLLLSYCFNHLFLLKTPFFLFKVSFYNLCCYGSEPSPSFPEYRSMATSFPVCFPDTSSSFPCLVLMFSALCPWPHLFFLPCSQLCALLPVQFLYASSSGALPLPRITDISDSTCTRWNSTLFCFSTTFSLVTLLFRKLGVVWTLPLHSNQT